MILSLLSQTRNWKKLKWSFVLKSKFWNIEGPKYIHLKSRCTKINSSLKFLNCHLFCPCFSLWSSHFQSYHFLANLPKLAINLLVKWLNWVSKYWGFLVTIILGSERFFKQDIFPLKTRYQIFFTVMSGVTI